MPKLLKTFSTEIYWQAFRAAMLDRRADDAIWASKGIGRALTIRSRFESYPRVTRLPRVRGWLTLKERKAIHQFFHGAIPAAEIAKKFRVSIPTIYNHARAGY
jgi:hypothetical protein